MNKLNKKGAITDVILWIVISFATVLFLAVWLLSHGILTDALRDAAKLNPTERVNITDAVEDTFGKVDAAMPILRIISFVIIFMLALSIFVSNFLIKANPVFFAVYFLIGIFAVVFSVPVSNAYENLMVDPLIGATLTSFSASSFFMLNLPYIVTILALVGALFLFMGTIRDPGAGGSVL